MRFVDRPPIRMPAITALSVALCSAPSMLFAFGFDRACRAALAGIDAACAERIWATM
jgi:hypothetical protein